MTDDKVVSLFKPAERPDMIFVCHCGCSAFQLHDDDRVECANCNETMNNVDSNWLPPIADAPQLNKDDPAVPKALVNVVSFNGAEGARNRVLNKARQDTAAVIVVIHTTGEVTTWSDDLETRDQRRWFRRQLLRARQLVEATYGDKTR